MRDERKDANGCPLEVEICSTAETYRRSNRLRTADQFSRALKSRRRIAARWFAAHVVEVGEQGPRLGLAVTKRTAPRAVDRNRIKRLVRETFRRHAWALGSVDLVIRLVRLPAPREWDKARLELGLLFERIENRSKPS